jgi:dTDP-4-amino-4,6-dideoxygalactose transaminase
MNTVSSADVLVLSLYPTKFANGIDGGVLLTDDPNVHGCAKRLMYYEDQYEFESEPRYNRKMNNINAAVALGSLDHMDEAASRLVEVYRHLSGVLDSVGMNYIAVSQAEVPTRLVVMAENNDQRDNWLRQLNGAGIQSGIELQYVCPQELKHRYPVCKTLVECNLSLPLHPLLKDLEVERIEAGIKRL